MHNQENSTKPKTDLPFNMELEPGNRWVKLAELFPWAAIEKEYSQQFKKFSNSVSKPSRLAFGALYIQMTEGFTDEQTRHHIQKSPYLQYFCGFKQYTEKSPFDPSMMTNFRKRISAEMIDRATALVFTQEAREQKDIPEQPADIDVLNEARKKTEEIIDILYKTITQKDTRKPRSYRQTASREYIAFTRRHTHTPRDVRNNTRRQLLYIERNLRSIEKLVKQGALLSSLSRELYHKLLVIQEMHRQQKMLSSSDIVSLYFAQNAQKQEDNPRQLDQEKNLQEQRGAAAPEVSKNKGTLILDADCCPANDVRYPTDIELINKVRKKTEEIVDILYKPISWNYDLKPRTYRQMALKEYKTYTRKQTHTHKDTRRVLKRQRLYAERNLRTIEELVKWGAPLSSLGRTLYSELLVIQEICRQHREMYDAKTYHVDDRIVSISQPHIRPIVRSREDEPTEFGIKVSIGIIGGHAFIISIGWANYEVMTLKDTAEKFRQTFGFYPKTIIGDKAFITRDNRQWCCRHGIRLSVPEQSQKTEKARLLGAKQVYLNSWDQNRTKGQFETGKQRHELKRVIANLPDTSMTSIAMGFFAANMERKLQRLSESAVSWFLDFDPDINWLVLLSYPIQPPI